MVEDRIQIQSGDNAQGDIELNELNVKIQSIVETMPNRCREVFLLSRYENLSHKEIAEFLQISEGTSRSQLLRARKLLKEKLIDFRQVPSNIRKPVENKLEKLAKK